MLDLVNAIRVSSDDFFYNLGALTQRRPDKHPNGGALQQWARKYGIGRPTGIDLGGENAGHPALAANGAPAATSSRRECEQRAPGRRSRGTAQHRAGGCGIADGRPPWSVGDNDNLAVGQGDLEATPLQLAVAYSAIENGGTVVRPHIGLEVERPTGPCCSRSTRRRRATSSIDPQYLDAIRPACTPPPRSRAAPRRTSSPTSQTAPGVRQDRNRPVHRPARPVVVCVLRARSPTRKPILVVVTVEQGGFGAPAAAPGRAADPVAVVLRQARPVRRRELEDAVSADRRSRPPERGRSARGRARWLLFDPLLLLAALGLVACSLVTLKGATRNAVPGHPLYYVERQAIYVGVGLVVALVLSADRLLAAARVQVRASTGC